jgi:heme-degrading monooxygenase HmoA
VRSGDAEADVIVRVLTARVGPREVGEFNDLLRGELAELREQPGLVYAKLARRLDERGGEEVVLFEEWATPADLWRWTGGRLTEPRLLPGTEELVEDLVITHYEALDMEMTDADAAIISSTPPARRGPNRPPATGEASPETASGTSAAARELP